MSARNAYRRYAREKNWRGCAILCEKEYYLRGTYKAVAEEFDISRSTAARYIQIARCLIDLRETYGSYKLSVRHGMALAMFSGNKTNYDRMKKHMEAYKLSGTQALDYAKALKGQKAAKIKTPVLIRKYMNGQIDFKVYVGNLSQKEEQRLLDRLFVYIEKIDQMSVALQEDIENKGKPK